MNDKKADKIGPQGTRVFNFSDVPTETDSRPKALATIEGVGLIGKSSDISGQSFKLHEGNNMVGRGSDNDVQLSHPSVSSKHARISQADGAWRVTNLLSSNGTFVNDQRVSQKVIEDGDELGFGDSVLVFQNAVESRSGVPKRFLGFLLVVLLIVLLTWLLIGLS